MNSGTCQAALHLHLFLSSSLSHTSTFALFFHSPSLSSLASTVFIGRGLHSSSLCKDDISSPCIGSIGLTRLEYLLNYPLHPPQPQALSNDRSDLRSISHTEYLRRVQKRNPLRLSQSTPVISVYIGLSMPVAPDPSIRPIALDPHEAQAQ
ncbi:hypothetical protein BJX96DRAFT_85311 [Aspergillus floccosus]